MSETTHLTDGDEIRLLGSGGAPVLLTVGRPFSAKEIQQKLGSGEWRREGDEPDESTAGPQPRTEKLSKPGDDSGPGPQPRTEKLSKPSDDPKPGSPQPRTEHLSQPGQRPDEGKAASSDPGRPAVNAPKADWITYVAGLKHMSIEDASTYTKDDLIEMAS